MRQAFLALFLHSAMSVCPGPALAACFEPLRPEARHLADAGHSGSEIRQAFRRYFTEVEEYLNCLNQTANRIRQDARAAAYDYNRVLETYPRVPEARPEDPAPSVEMTDTGKLFLDYRP